MRYSVNQTERIAQISRERHWPVRVLGSFAMPKERVDSPSWYLLPIEQDDSQIPARAVGRVQQLLAEGIRPQGFLIAHEKRSPVQMSVWALGAALSPVVALASHLVAPTLIATVAHLLAPVVVLAAIDPVLILVTEDGTWIEIDRWDEA